MGLRTSTPASGTLSPAADGANELPAARLEQLRRIERLRRDADHRLAEPGGDTRENLRIAVVRRRLDDRLRAPFRIARLEDARTDEDAGGAELHAQGCIG